MYLSCRKQIILKGVEIKILTIVNRKIRNCRMNLLM